MLQAYTNFNKAQFSNQNIRWFGKIGYVALGHHVGQIHLFDTHYVATVIDREHGEIARADFYFAEYLEIDPKNTHPNAFKNGPLRTWRGCADPIQWYIDRPKSFKPLEDAIFEFFHLIAGI